MLLRRLAVGGMAEVYVAKTKGIGGFEKLVAIKVIHPRFSEDEHFVQMLVEEAKISVQLNHVNIAQTFDLGCIDDTYFISMEYVEGADTFRVQKRARDQRLALPIDICCHIAAEICNGLSYAHRKRDAEGSPLGIVHRDISPQNVLVSYSGEVKIVDFGIAKAALRGGQTEVGVIKGKYYYMSPEQAWGDPVDHRTDVFATGLLLHELLTGEMVYQEENVPALLDRVRKAQIPSPRARRKDVPEELAAVIAKAVAKEASDRFQSAHAFAQELNRVLYQINPTFNASRMAQLMGTLFPEEVRRHSQILKLPPAEAARPSPSEEVELQRMSREEFAPSAEASVIYDLDDVEEMTRNDILPFRKQPKPAAPAPSRADRPTKELRAPAPSREEDTTAQRPAHKDEWDEETLLKSDKEGWDESTLVDRDGSAMKDVRRLIAARHAVSDDDPTTDLTAEKTVAMASFPGPAASVLPRPAPPAPRPAPPPPRRVPPPRPAPAAELPSEKTVALAQSHAPVDAPDELPPERTVALGASGTPELPPEKTMALGHGAPIPPPRRQGGLAGPSKAAIRLGPEADRFFAPSNTGEHAALSPAPPASATFDPFGGAPQPPIAMPLQGRDPFVAQPPPVVPAEALGKPDPRRWIVVGVLGVVALVGLIVLGTWLAARPGPTTLVLDSSPPGATVEIDGHAVSGRTPITVEPLEAGRTYHVQLQLAGYEPRVEEIRVGEGENRNIFVLNPIRVTLHVETQPPGAQVWVDNVLRGSAPLDIPNLSPGTTVRLRSWAPGHETVMRELPLTETEHDPRVMLTLPRAGTP